MFVLQIRENKFSESNFSKSSMIIISHKITRIFRNQFQKSHRQSHSDIKLCEFEQLLPVVKARSKFRTPRKFRIQKFVRGVRSFALAVV